MSKWQPIETAPLNQSVLVYIENAEHYGPGIYRALLSDFGRGRQLSINALHMGRDCPHDYMPSHWMPLPEPPK